MEKSIYFLVQSYASFNYKDCQKSSPSYDTINKAKEKCSADPECKMFYDACGQGTTYELCQGYQQKQNSRCGSVLYVKEGK